MTREEKNSREYSYYGCVAAGINTRWMGLRLAKSRSRRFRAVKAKAKPVQNKTVRVRARANDGEALGKRDEAKWSDWCNRTLPPGCVWQGQDDIVVAPSFILRAWVSLDPASRRQRFSNFTSRFQSQLSTGELNIYLFIFGKYIII